MKEKMKGMQRKLNKFFSIHACVLFFEAFEPYAGLAGYTDCYLSPQSSR